MCSLHQKNNEKLFCNYFPKTNFVKINGDATGRRNITRLWKTRLRFWDYVFQQLVLQEWARLAGCCPLNKLCMWVYTTAPVSLSLSLSFFARRYGAAFDNRQFSILFALIRVIGRELWFSRIFVGFFLFLISTRFLIIKYSHCKIFDFLFVEIFAFYKINYLYANSKLLNVITLIFEKVSLESFADAKHMCFFIIVFSKLPVQKISKQINHFLTYNWKLKSQSVFSLK